ELSEDRRRPHRGRDGRFALHDPVGQGEGLHRRRGRARDHPQDPRSGRLLRRDVDDRQAAALGLRDDHRGGLVPGPLARRVRALRGAGAAHREHGDARARHARARGRPQDRHARADGRLRARREHAARAFRLQQRQAHGGREALAAGPRQHGGRLARDGEPHTQGPLGSGLHLDRVEVDHDHQQRAAAIAVTTVPGTQPRLARALREAAWITLAAAGIYLALILATFSRSDPGPSFSGSGAPLANKGGMLGAWLADAFYYVFGMSAWWWVALAVVCILRLYRRVEQWELLNRRTLALSLVGFAIVLAASCT